MSVIERQRRSNRAIGQGSDPESVDVIPPEGRPPVQDNPTNDMNVYGPETATPLGEQPGADVPFDKNEFEKRAEAAQERYIPILPDAETAVRTLRYLKDNGEQVKAKNPQQYAKAMKAVKLFRAENPGAMQNYVAQEKEQSWIAQNVDTEPTEDSRARRAKIDSENRRYASFAPGLSEMVNGEQGPGKIVPGSREETLLRLEGEGVDTLSGFGDFATTFRAGMEFNSPRARAAFMEAAVREQLLAEGIEVPASMPVVKVQDDLQQLMFMSPTEDGKVKWTLADSEVFRPEDIGAVSDLPSLLSIAGAAAANLAPQGRITKGFFAAHPMLGEFVGDLGGRQLGTMLEYLISTGEVTPEEFRGAMLNNHMSSLFETVVSRATGRAIQATKNIGKTRVAPGQEDAARAELNEAADVLTDITRLSDGKKINISRAEATGDTVALQEQAGREKTLTKKARDRVERFRLENKETYAHINRRIAQDEIDRSSPNSVDFDATRLEQTENALNSVRRSPAEGGAGAVQRETVFEDLAEDGNPLASRYRYYVEGDKSAPDEVKDGWQVVVDHVDNTVQIHMAFAGGTFKNQGPRIVQQMIDDFGDLQGYRWYSDNSVSPSAQRMIEGLNGAGWDIRLADPENTMVRRQADGETVFHLDDTSTQGTRFTDIDSPGVYEIVGIPGKQLRNPLPSVEWDEYVMREMVDDVASMVPELEIKAAQDNNFLRRTIGWSNQTQVSNVKIDNPGGSPIRQTVRRIENRRKQALDGTSQKEADQRLAAVTTTEADEEGFAYLAGLAGDTLDYGQLTKTERKLYELFQETGDEDVGILLDQVRRRLEGGGNWSLADGTKLQGAAKANITSAWQRTDMDNEMLQEAIALTNGSNLFARNTNGELLNVNLQAMRRYLGSETQFMKQMAPVLKTKPDLVHSLRGALREIYEQDIIKTGWTRSKHNSFMKKYDQAMRGAWSADEVADFQRYSLQSNTTEWKKKVEFSTTLMNRTRQRMGWDSTVEFNSNNILGSLRGMKPAKIRGVLRDLKNDYPEMYADVQRMNLRQIEHKLHNDFFDVGEGVTDPFQRAKGFEKWFEANEETLRGLHGDQYVTDMRALKNTLKIEAKRSRVRGNAPDTQPLWLRVTRTVFGPLSRPQRQMSAGTFTQQRLAAQKVLQLYSDPEKLRQIKFAGNLPGNSRAAVAVLARVGFFDAFGIHPEDENYIELAHEKWMEIIQASNEAEEDGNVE